MDTVLSVAKDVPDTTLLTLHTDLVKSYPTQLITVRRCRFRCRCCCPLPPPLLPLLMLMLLIMMMMVHKQLALLLCHACAAPSTAR